LRLPLRTWELISNRCYAAAVGSFSKPATEQAGKVYTEEDWNPITEKECEEIKSDE